MKVDITNYALLYSLYSWPNVVLSVFGGFLLDRVFGVRWGAIIFSIFVCAGQLVFALGAFFNSFITMVAGRFIFGYVYMRACTYVLCMYVEWIVGLRFCQGRAVQPV